MLILNKKEAKMATLISEKYKFQGKEYFQKQKSFYSNKGVTHQEM